MTSRAGNPRLVVLHSPESAVAARDVLKSTTDLAHVTFVVDSGAPQQWVDILSGATEVRKAHRGEWLGVIADLRPSGVVTFTDYLVPLADEIVGKLRLHGSAASGTWDKLHQRQRLRNCGSCDIEFTGVRSTADLIAARGLIPGELILKPRHSYGGYGIQLISSDLTEEELLGLPIEWERYGQDGFILEQRFVDDEKFSSSWQAPYVSVDSISCHNRHHPIALLGKFRLYSRYIETGDFAPVAMDEELRSSIFDCVIASLDCLGITDRVTHTEVRLTATGPQVIEVNGRIGGDVHTLWSWLTGQDLVRAAAAAACGHPVDIPPEFHTLHGYAANVRIPVRAADQKLLRRARRIAASASDFWKVDSPPRVTPKLGIWFRASSGDPAGAVRQLMRVLLSDEELRNWCDSEWLTSMAAAL